MLSFFISNFNYALANYEIVNENNSVNIKTEVSAEANSKTGKASAESRVKVESSIANNNDEEKNNEIKVEATAEANGEKVETKISDTENENIIIKKESGDEKNQAKLEIEVTNNSQEQTIEKNNADDFKIKNTLVLIKDTTKTFFENIKIKLDFLFL